MTDDHRRDHRAGEPTRYGMNAADRHRDRRPRHRDLRRLRPDPVAPEDRRLLSTLTGTGPGDSSSLAPESQNSKSFPAEIGALLGQGSSADGTKGSKLDALVGRTISASPTGASPKSDILSKSPFEPLKSSVGSPLPESSSASTKTWSFGGIPSGPGGKSSTSSLTSFDSNTQSKGDGTANPQTLGKEHQKPSTAAGDLGFQLTSRPTNPNSQEGVVVKKPLPARANTLPVTQETKPVPNSPPPSNRFGSLPVTQETRPSVPQKVLTSGSSAGWNLITDVFGSKIAGKKDQPVSNVAR